MRAFLPCYFLYEYKITKQKKMVTQLAYQHQSTKSSHHKAIDFFFSTKSHHSDGVYGKVGYVAR